MPGGTSKPKVLKTYVGPSGGSIQIIDPGGGKSEPRKWTDALTSPEERARNAKGRAAYSKAFKSTRNVVKAGKRALSGGKGKGKGGGGAGGGGGRGQRRDSQGRFA